MLDPAGYPGDPIPGPALIGVNGPGYRSRFTRALQTKANKDTQARDRAGQAPAPAPVYPRRGARPPYARKGGAGQEVTRHPRLRTTGTRQAPPAPFVHARTGHANARQPPPLQPPLPFARKGGSSTETRRTGPDAGRRGTRHAHPPLPPLSRDPARKQRQRRRGGPPGLRAEAKRKRGVHARGRERARPPPSAPRPRLDARAARERGRALQVGVCPRVRAHGQRANRNAQKRSPLHDTGASEPGGRARAKRERADARKRPPPFPGSRARAKCERAAARNPLPSPAGSPAREKRERATTRKPPPPPLPRVRVQGRNATAWRKRPPPPWVARIHVLPLCAKRKSTAFPVHEWEGGGGEQGQLERVPRSNLPGHLTPPPWTLFKGRLSQRFPKTINEGRWKQRLRVKHFSAEDLSLKRIVLTSRSGFINAGLEWGV
ncbi:hypothetical protein EDB83DRAFT_2591080 [Lactarius deliciosus]|nr:hypothetical protein EDB83DRAFT_2591080 [Lactarius deliciosus]